MRKAMLAVLMVAAAGCSSSGQVQLQMTDAPLSLSDVKAVNITLSKVDVHLAGEDKTESDDPTSHATDHDGDWQTVLEQGKQFDLMQLRNDATTELGTLDLPTGKITQIRLFVDTSKPENNQVVFNDGHTCNLDTGEVDQTGIKITHPFKAIGVKHDVRVTIKLDFDAASSVDDQRNGDTSSCNIRLRPVINLKGEPVESPRTGR